MNDNSSQLYGIEQLKAELVKEHAIDLTHYVDGAITLGLDSGWEDALERCAKSQIANIDPKGEMSNGELATKQREINRRISRKRVLTPENNWNIYGVYIDRQGKVNGELEFFGQRLHPTNRRKDQEGNQIKFDASGVRSSLYLPPITRDFADELLCEYGFDINEKEWTPGEIWQWVYEHPEVSIWIEESALKALAATSGGQLAIGLNGIDSGCQKQRKDRLRLGLKKLAQGSRRITVRFDHGLPSEREAYRLSHLLNKHGANAGWWCYLPHWHLKTDDYMAARLRGNNDPLVRQDLVRVVGEWTRNPYTRLKERWTGITLSREFEAHDIIQGLTESRIVALRGATGTAKSKAILAAVQELEIIKGKRLTILGLYCRASLVHKGAYEFGVRDISAKPGTAERQFGYHEGRVIRDGLFCCPESIYKPNSQEETLWTWSNRLFESPRDVILVLDELTQTMLHMLLTGTERMPMIRRDCIQSLERLITNPCVQVIAAEAALGDEELQWLAGLSKTSPYLIRTDWIREKKVYVGDSTKANVRIIKALIAQTLKQGESVWCGFGTKAMVEEFEICFKDHYKTLVIHGDNSSSEEVSEFVSNTENVGPLYQLVVYSPAVSSGISMASTTVGLSVYVQQYAVSAEDALQALNRCRDAKRRVLLTQKTAVQALVGTQQTTPEAVNNSYHAASVFGEQAHYIRALQACTRETLEYALAIEARANYEAFNNEHVLRSRLVEDGYEILSLELLSHEQSSQPTPKKQRIKRIEKPLCLRQKLLRDLLRDQLTKKEAGAKLQEATRNGLIVDIRNDDPVQAYEWLISLRVKELANLSSFTVETREFIAVIQELKALHRKEVRALRRLFGRLTVPGPDDPVQVGPVKTLLWHAGHHAGRAQRTSNNGLWIYSVHPIIEESE